MDPPQNNESDEDFLKRLKRLGEDWRYSDEFIGIIVRCRFPRDYIDIYPKTSGYSQDRSVE